MMHRQNEKVFLAIETQEPRTEQRSLLQIKRLTHGFNGQLHCAGHLQGFWQQAEVDEGQWHIGWLGNALDWFTVCGSKCRPQCFVTPNDFRDGKLQGRCLEGTGEAQIKMIIVMRSGLKAVEKPEPLLGEGEREITGVLPGGNASGHHHSRKALFVEQTIQQLEPLVRSAS
jgi:hypothetical protein